MYYEYDMITKIYIDPKELKDLGHTSYYTDITPLEPLAEHDICFNEQQKEWFYKKYKIIYEFNSNDFNKYIRNSKVYENESVSGDNSTIIPPPNDFETTLYYFDKESSTWVNDVSDKKLERDLFFYKQTLKKRLEKSDWSVLDDVSIQNREEWIAYRSQLRTLLLDLKTERVIKTIPQEPSVIWN